MRRSILLLAAHAACDPPAVPMTCEGDDIQTFCVHCGRTGPEDDRADPVVRLVLDTLPTTPVEAPLVVTGLVTEVEAAVLGVRIAGVNATSTGVGSWSATLSLAVLQSTADASNVATLDLHVRGACAPEAWTEACADDGCPTVVVDPDAVFPDQDADGYADRDLGGDDCNDDDSAIHPEADETAGDGVDQNCDGSDDT